VGPNALDGINLIISNTDPSLLKAGEINALWNHHSYDQAAVANMRHQQYVDAIDYFVYAPHWQYEKFRMAFKIPEKKSVVHQKCDQGN
jgi:hypothetical protein